MKKTIILYIFITLNCLTSSVFALSIGNIHVHSHFAEPFRAEISVPSFDETKIKQLQIGIANQEEFAKRGIERPEILNDFQFELIKKDSKDFTVFISSNIPVKELSLGLLVEVIWSNGSVIKAYDIILTPSSISHREHNSVIAQVLTEQTGTTLGEALMSLVAHKNNHSQYEFYSLARITTNLSSEWQALIAHSSFSENSSKSILQANTGSSTITNEQIVSKKLELENVQEMVFELDAQNESLRTRIEQLEEELLLSTHNIFNDNTTQAENEFSGSDSIAEGLGSTLSNFSLDSVFSDELIQKELLIAALLLLIVLLVILRKKDVIKQKLQVRKNRRNDAEAKI